MPLGDKESLVEAAVHCDDCVGWLEHCKAECCQVFTFSLTPRSDVVYAEDTVRIHAPVTPDGQRYYELHGAHVDGDFITVPRSACAVFTTRLVVTMPCRVLRDDLLCSLHDEGQPDCCADFTWETASQDDWVVTPRCLFAYKQEALRRGLGLLAPEKP
jgi:hypothetical protein